MAISDKTRKILWARSGGLCAFCRRTLVEEGTKDDVASVVGDECHIIGEKRSAARGEFGVGRDDLDEYDNLVLLCKVDHKRVDDQRTTYTVERLRMMKAMHEQWVMGTLSKLSRHDASPRFRLLNRIRTAKELTIIIDGVYGAILDHDELETENESTLVGGFHRSLEDLADVWAVLDSGNKVKTHFSLTSSLKDLEAAGFLIFGMRETRNFGSREEPFVGPMAVITVVRPTNKGITELGQLASLILH